MGNIHASNFGGLSAPPMTAEPPMSSQNNNITEESKNVPPILPPSSNPGTMEELHKKCKDIYPMVFEGAKLVLNKPISEHFQVAHTINLSSSSPSGYKFGATYVGNQQVSPVESYPVILGEIDPSGDLNANMIHQITPYLKVKFVSQISKSKWVATQFTSDFIREYSTSSVTLGNIDLLNASGVAVAHHLHKITKECDVGVEVAYQFGSHVPRGGIAAYSAGGRYNGESFTASATGGPSGLHACFYKKASESLQLGVELETSLRMKESTASMAYQVEIPKADFTFKGSLDTNWTVSALLEKKLMPLPFTFALAMSLNHPKNQFKIGCGMVIG